jgi:FKBP-type peptidyl-prolyl cis-trans isomerase 2
MKKILILLAVAILLFSGCVDQKTGNQKTGNQKTVKIGDNVSVDYTGSINGKIFDTSIENIAKENNLSVPNRIYKPLRLIVGKGQVIKGFDEGIIGMKVGESKTLTIPPEKAYGPKDPQLVQTVPIIQNAPTIKTFLKVFQIPVDRFNVMFGGDHKIGDSVKIPGANINLTVIDINTSNVLVSYNLQVGDKISQSGAPWNETVIKIDDKNVTVRSEVKKNDKIQFEGAPWNTTVVDVDSENITLRHNSIPDTNIRDGLYLTRVRFNETYITMDRNNELAGETLIFNIAIKSID